ncbi:MAG: type II secretion system protein GspK [Hyphomicrobiaceae bacterium]|nr:type II secretion system protein GspK [Hyphomicrobiaceae bacterium]
MLFVVLWVVLLLALAGVGFSVTIRSALQERSAISARAEAAALAEAGVNLAIHDLVNAQWSRSWRRRFPPDNRSYTCSLDGHVIVVTVSDEMGKVDINGAGGDLLRALLAGVEAADADKLVANILDFRDADSSRRPGGAERDDYVAAGRSGLPKNATFDSPYELAQVLDIDAATLARLLPHVTTFTGQSGVDPAKASDALKGILSGGMPGRGADTANSGAFRARWPAAFTSVSSQRVFSIRSLVRSTRGGTFQREAIVRVVARRTDLYTILSWKQVDATPVGEPIELGPC